MTDSEKVQFIKDLHLFTRNHDEWDEKFKRFRGDATEIMAQIRRECEEKYPSVDLDTFLWSYSEFDRRTTLRNMLNPKRSAIGARLRTDQDFLVSVMRRLLGYPLGDNEEAPKIKDDVLRSLQDLDLPVVLLVFFPFGNEPLLPPFKKRVGDLDESIDLYSLVSGSLRDVLVKLYPPSMPFAENPFTDKACEALSPRAVGHTAKKVTIMDVVNLVYGVFDNIDVNTYTAYRRYANDAVLENRVKIDLPKKLWRTNRGSFCRIDALDDGYLLTHYYKHKNVFLREEFFLSAFYDDDGQMLAYAESSKVFRQVVNGVPLSTEDATHYTFKLYDGESLLERITTEKLHPTRIVLGDYLAASKVRKPGVLPFSSLEVVDDPPLDKYTDDNTESAHPDDDFTLTPLVWHLTPLYVYVQCTAEQVSLKTADGTSVPSLRVTSWYRLPRYSGFPTSLGDESDLASVGDGDIVCLRSFVENGVRREFITFLNLSLFIEVTHVKNPEVGYEFPCGVTIVPSPSSTLNAQLGWVMSVAKAVYKGDSKADVTYEVYTSDDDNPHYLTVSEDVVVVGE